MLCTVFEIKVLFCAPSGRTGSYSVHPAACPCTPIVYSHNNSLKKRAHTQPTAQKNVRPSTEMCAPGAVCTLNFEHCMYNIQYFGIRGERCAGVDLNFYHHRATSHHFVLARYVFHQYYYYHQETCFTLKYSQACFDLPIQLSERISYLTNEISLMVRICTSPSG